MTTPERPAVTAVGPTRRGRLLEAGWWSALVLVPAWLVARGSENRGVVLGLGLVVAAVVFAMFARRDPTLVSDEEIRLRRRTVRRADVTRVTGSSESTALAFRGPDGAIVALTDPMGRSRAFRDALRQHGWPPVENDG